MKYFKWVVLCVILIFSSHMSLKVDAIWLSTFNFLMPLAKNSFGVDTVTQFHVGWLVLITCMLLCSAILSVIISSQMNFSKIGNKLISYLLTGFFIKQLFCFLYDGNKSTYYDYVDAVFIAATVALFFVKSKRWNQNKSGIDVIINDNVFYIESESPKYFLPWLYSLVSGRDKPHKKIVYNGMEYLYNWRFKFVSRPYRSLGGYVEQFNCDSEIAAKLNSMVGLQGSYYDPCENVIGKVVRAYEPDVNQLDENSKLKYLYNNV